MRILRIFRFTLLLLMAQFNMGLFFIQAERGEVALLVLNLALCIMFIAMAAYQVENRDA